jgi:hypothetical protein
MVRTQKAKRKASRFIMVEADTVAALSKGSFASTASVIADSKTGVQYLYFASGYGGGLTVLVDENGKPIVDKTLIIDEEVKEN